MDAAGRVHVTWYTGAEGREWVYYAASDEDGEFGPPVPLTRPAETTTSQTGLAADRSGAVWLAWEEWEADGKRIRLAYPCRCARRAARLT